MIAKTLAIAIIVGITAALAISVAATTMTAAHAAIEPVCRNGAGNENNGCNDNNQPPQDEQNENPSGHAPPGQNK